MKRMLLAAAGAAACWTVAAPSSAQQIDARTAQYLAANCANCHGTVGKASGAMPNLAGQNKAYMVEQLRAFRDGKRPATIMHQLAKGYSDAQIEAIAEHFSRQGAK